MSTPDSAAAIAATAEAPTAEDVRRLEESFRLFTATSRDMEKAYETLARRSSRIDLELARTNKRLSAKVAELEALDARSRGLLDALPVGVVVLDACGDVVTVNAAAERMLGRCALELVGRARDAVVGPTGDRLLAALDDDADEREIVALDGARRRLAISRATLPDGCELQVLSDLTVVTRLREQVGRLDTLANLGEMAAGIAHEIRNPLNGISGFAALLRRGHKDDLSADGLRYVGNIEKGVREVDAIIANMLTFAAPDALRRSAVRPAALLEEVVDQARAFRRDDGAALGLEIADDARDLAAQGDPVKLKIVFTNLVKNALEAVADDGRVDVDVAREGREIRIAVTDDGGGIPEEMRQRLFQPFATTKAQGTGLGLAIAHKFVTLHGGRIDWAATEHGTRFTVHLPATTEETTR